MRFHIIVLNHALRPGRQLDALSELEKVVRVILLVDHLQAEQIAFIIGPRVLLQIGIKVVHIGIAWKIRSHGVVPLPHFGWSKSWTTIVDSTVSRRGCCRDAETLFRSLRSY